MVGCEMQNILISKILNPIAKIMEKIDERVKNIIFIIAGIGIFVQFLLMNADIVNYRYLYIYIVFCACIGIMILCSLKADIKPLKFDKFLLYPLLAYGFFRLLSAFLYLNDYFLNAVDVLIVFPIIYIVANSLDFNKIFRLLNLVVIFSFVIFLIYSMVFLPIEGRRYKSFFTNENDFAFYLTTVFCSLLIENFNIKKLNLKAFSVWILFGLNIGLLLYSNSRTGQYGAIITASLALILFLIMQRNNLKKVILLNIIPVALFSVAFLIGTIYVFNAVSNVGIFVDNFVASFNQEEVTTSPDDSSDSSKDEEGKTQLEIFDEILSYNDKKTDTTDKTLDQISTGRISIWKVYLSGATLFGTSNNEALYVEAKDQAFSTAHMLWIEIAYESGFIAAAFYLILNIFAGLKSIKFAWKNNKNVYALFPFLVAIMFGFVAALSSPVHPCTYMITLLYFFSLIPLMKKED